MPDPVKYSEAAYGDVGTALVVNDISNVNITSVADDQVLAYDAGTGKFRPETNFSVGGFIKFQKENGTRDDLPLTTTFVGDQLISGTVEFFLQNGTQDDIDLITNGV